MVYECKSVSMIRVTIKTSLLAFLMVGTAHSKRIKRERILFNQNIVKLCKENSFFRKEIITGSHSQVVLMSIPAGEEIGEEVHTVDQTLIFVSGHGKAIVEGSESDVYPDHLVFISAGTTHNFKNTGSKELKLFTIYAPVQHKQGTIQKIKDSNFHHR